MKKFLSYILTTTALLASCASEDFTVSEGTPSSTTTDNTITILADRQDFTCGDNTRSAYSGITMSFESGDRIGVYIVNGTTVVSSNVCFTWDGTKWSSATDVGYNAGYDYYAYYPYVASPYTPDFTQTGIKNQFRLFIDDASNKFHQADQSTKAAFNASDLCIAQATHLAPRLIKFSLEHKKGLAVFNGRDAAAATFSGSNLPYTVGSERYFLMPYGTATSFTEDIGGTYALHAAIGKYITHPIVDVPLTFIALENGTFSFSRSGLSYSLDDGETWTALSAGANTPTVTAGNKIMWKNNTTLTPNSYDGIGTFSSTGNFNVEGNIMSLLNQNDKSTEISFHSYNYAFRNLFTSTKVINARKLRLPELQLPQYAYQQMFQNCSSLTTAPALPATNLEEYCYDGMFGNCTSLTNAPELPATTLAEACYTQMFNYCTSLTTAPALPATSLAHSCYHSMFYRCTSLTAAPQLPATTLAQSCYGGMFWGCTSLTSAPELPATTLAQSCYSSMFYNCTSLTTAPALPATTLSPSCYAYMFDNCLSLTTAPELPATMLASNCYICMFSDCTSLNSVKAAFTTTPDTGYTTNWLFNVAATGTFYKNSAATWTKSEAGIPNGWTVENYTP